MLKKRLLALALTGSLTGCLVEPYPEDPFDPNFPDGPSSIMPDLQIESVTGPSSLGSNSQDFLRARLCNRGGSLATTDVSFFLSKDKVLDPLDRRVGTSEQVTVKA